MHTSQLRDALLALPADEKKQLLLETFPEIAREALRDPDLLMRLLPLFLQTLAEQGIDPRQLVKLADLFVPAPQTPPAR